MTRPAVFLDRDGTLIADRHYLADPGEVEILPGVDEAMARLRSAGYLLVVISNQSGIGRGYFTEADHDRVTEEVRRRLSTPPDAFYHCPHRPDFGCACRKPKPGLLLRAARDLPIDLAASWSVGDRERDCLAGLATGGRAVLLAPGPAPEGALVARDLAEAVERILAPAGNPG